MFVRPYAPYSISATGGYHRENFTFCGAKMKPLFGSEYQNFETKLMNELLYQVALTKIPLVGAVTAKNLVSYCGSAEAVFKATKKQLLKIPGIGNVTVANVLDKASLDLAEQEIEFIEQQNVRPIFYLDDDYPKRLRQNNDAPVMLYFKGNAELNTSRIIGIVGTRTPTPYGISICEKLVEELKPYNPLVVSGLAYGVDATAHKKCVEIGLPTLAVLGHGLSTIYPAQNRKLAERMIENGGVLTEFASHVPPDRENFPMRNRIVAGLCDALIVVETAERGGSMITANLASGYSRDVFAVPGRVKDKFSQGCNLLIKKNIASLIHNADDVARHMSWASKKEDSVSNQPKLFLELTEPEKKIVDLIQEKEELGVDQLSYLTHMRNTELAALLLNLEFQGVVRSLPGKRYVLS